MNLIIVILFAWIFGNKLALLINKVDRAVVQMNESFAGPARALIHTVTYIKYL